MASTLPWTISFLKSLILPNADSFKISLFQTPVGAFIVFAVILAVIAFVKNRKAELKANLAKQEKARKAAEMQAQIQAGGAKQ